jgi:teichuronic acid biosynthesis glycosyltransferase TuaC
MNVLMVSTIFPNAAEKVRGVFTFQIAKALQEFCHIQVVAPLPWIPTFLKGALGERYAHRDVGFNENIGDIRVFHPRYPVIPKMLGFLHATFLSYPLLKAIRTVEGAWPIDVINAHWIFPEGVASVWVARKLGKPVVLTALGCDLNLYSTLVFRERQIRNGLLTANKVTVKSSGLREKVLGLNVPDRKISVISNGVNFHLFRKMEREEARSILGIEKGGKIVLTVGSLDEVKGTTYLIDAVGKLKKMRTGLPRFYIIGEGPLKNRLVSQSKQIGMEGSIVFLGQIPHEEIPFWMNAADVFCLPSIREGYPNAVLEALACGTPVVASDVGAIQEMIHHQSGYITRPGDSDSLCDGLLKCLSHDWDREVIRETIKGFSWQACAEAYFKVYSNVIKKN